MHKEVQKACYRKYFAHAQTVCTRHLLGGEGPGNEAHKHHVIDHHGVNNVSHLRPNPTFISPPDDTALVTGMCTSCVCHVVVLVQLRTATMVVAMTTLEACLNQ